MKKIIFGMVAVGTVFAASVYASAGQGRSADIAQLIKGRARETAATSQRRYILTGGPCVGKTSIIHGLSTLGYTVVPEAATEVIAEEQAQGNSEPWKNPDFDLKISDRIYQRQQESSQSGASIVFFDRGPIDPLSYACYYNYSIHPTIISRVEEILEKPFYETTVFLIAPLIEELYENSVIRYEDRATSEKLGDYLAQAYKVLGFSVVKVPFGTIPQRVQWIVRYIETLEKMNV